MLMPVLWGECCREVLAVQEHKTIQSFLEVVAEQIRWKRARPVVTAELEHHLEDQRDAFAEDGFENAEALAVEEMGDPVTVGTELDRIHRPRPQWGMITLTVVLALAGTLLRILLTAEWKEVYLAESPLKALTAFALGCVALLAGYFLDYSRLSRHAGKIYLGTLAVSLVVERYSPIINGAPYYARFITLLFPIVYALWLYSCRNKRWRGLVMSILGGVPLALFCCDVPYMLGLAVHLISGLVLVVVAAWNDWFGIGRLRSLIPPLACVGAIMGMLTYMVMVLEWGAGRLSATFHPEIDPLGQGFQALRIRDALVGSKWIGEGMWTAELFRRPYEMTVPGCESDTFLTTVIYKLGWVPFLLLALVFAALMLWLLFRCTKQKSQLGRLIVIAVVVSLSVQAMVSIAWNMGFTLLSASFPLIIGNLNTMLNMGLIGLALSVFRGDSIARNSESSKIKRNRIRVRLIFERV